MKKLIVLSTICFLSHITNAPVSATEPNHNSSSVIKNVITDSSTALIYNIYQQIDFGNYQALSFEIFNKAYRGYTNLKTAGKLSDQQILTVADFTKAGSETRLWVIDLKNKKILYHTYVAHGQGSGLDYANQFSNNNESHQSSLGFYVTGATYTGEHGLSCRLNGMDEGFNSAALDRGIVLHGAEYVCKSFIQANEHLGRSWGCPALPAALYADIINKVKNGTCLYIYYPDKKYMNKSVWLNKTIDIASIPAGTATTDVNSAKKLTQNTPQFKPISKDYKVTSIKELN